MNLKLILYVLFSARNTFACDCIIYTSYSEEILSSYTHIVRGIVIDIDTVNFPSADTSDYGEYDSLVKRLVDLENTLYVYKIQITSYSRVI